MMNELLLVIVCVVLSVAAIKVAIKLSNIYSLADHPGEHKQHGASTPFVGGVGIFVTLGIALIILIDQYPEHLHKWLALGFCSTVIFVTGLVDDIVLLSYKFRLIIQAIVAFIMVLVGGIVLNDLGGLFFGFSLQPGLVATLFTVFAIIGGINIINMIDGIDGLSGSLSLASLLLLGVVAYVAADVPNFLLIVALFGGLCGFLFYNLRYPSQSRARAFLGDNGSMLIGLLFAWLLVDLSQGSSPAMQPVAAIWLLAIPLMDAFSVMHRRVHMGVSPFKPDWNHLHHILLKAGYRVEEVVLAMVSLHLIIGVIGLAALYFGVPDFIMLFLFILIYAAYFYLTLHPWHYIASLCFLHTRMGLTPAASSGTFEGKYTVTSAENLAMKLSKEVRSRMDYWIQIFKQHPEGDGSRQYYALTFNLRLPKGNSNSGKSRYIALLKQRLGNKHGIHLRQLVARKGDKDWEAFNPDSDLGGLNATDKRRAFRRSLGFQVLVFEVICDAESLKEEKAALASKNPKC